MDPLSEAKLVDVAPELAGKIRSLAEMMDLAGDPVRVMAGFRDYSLQAALFEQGRMLGGTVVTNARPGASWHDNISP